jgi:RNA polymerase sigma-70 factor (ECF subfamily)
MGAFPVGPFEQSPGDVQNLVGEIYRAESRRVLATLIRLVGDFELAEDAMHEAFAAAMVQWAKEGVPRNPTTWLVSTGRFKAIDTLRRRAKHDAPLPENEEQLSHEPFNLDELDEARFKDDQLRLIFTCCHPALAPETQVALTLREVCGLTTEEVASAFLTPRATIAQRIVRGKAKIREAGIPYAVPSLRDLPERLESVLSVIYLVYNEGYSASSGDSLTRADLSSEAIHLARILLELHPDPEVMGLLALMLLHDSRRHARATAEGDIILLQDQDRSLWNYEQIGEGTRLVEQALRTRRFGTYTIQAAIAAVHAEARSTEDTDWREIVALYDILLRINPSPVVALNRAVAVAMRDGPEAGLALVEDLLARGDLAEYHLAHATHGDLCRRLGRSAEARESFNLALTHARTDTERRFLEMRLREVG